MKLLKGNKSGITLIEALAVIGLGALLIAGGLILFGDAQDANRIKNETTNISAILKRMEEVFSEDDMSSITMEEMLQAGIFNKSMKVVGTDVYNSWNGTVTITPQDVASYDVEYTSVPVNETCVDFVKATRKIGFDEIQVGSETKTDISDISISNIISWCDEGTVGGNYVDIVWSMTNGSSS